MRGPSPRGSVCIGFAATTAFFLWVSEPARAGWEAGLRVASDSNVTRSVDGETGDSYLTGSLGYNRDVPGDRRLDWTAAATVEGTVYREVTELNDVALSFVLGVVYVPRPGWTLAASPFLQSRTFHDGDQSAVAWGTRFSLQQQLGGSFYLAEFYTYTDSNARKDVYSYQEHALGASAGYHWTPSLSTEVGYQYAHGDSFRTLDSSGADSDSLARQGTGSMGAGATGTGGRHGIQGFGGEVIKESVNTHQLSATIGYSWTHALVSYVGCSLSVSDGSTGTSRSRAAYLGAAYGF